MPPENVPDNATKKKCTLCRFVLVFSVTLFFIVIIFFLMNIYQQKAITAKERSIIEATLNAEQR